ncbi:MAG: DNA-3-methyladenine glycosylase 2 family protein [Polyangiaceae bacterium]|nr:DNA-3-methyladenine glycosylase 2 family protein [Myxococcales bacterium]MCB9584619.1 DNA-3-methyladenine glycosylase 2 family protein [Polyangiaceae bacterium]
MSENGQFGSGPGCTTIDVTNDDQRYRALGARDHRFDGVFFVAVSSTGIYCRPICPARLPVRKNCTFYDTAAEAERAGYRACFRCRPELSPGSAPTDRKRVLADRAYQRIRAGALNDGNAVELAQELGVSERHLRRAVQERFGISPVELAQTARLGLAKQLLHDTQLPLSQICHASGFGSVRRFNALFKARMGRSPSELRKGLDVENPGAQLTLRLDYRPPLAFSELLAFLRQRAIPGVEQVDDVSYARLARIDGHTGWLEVRADGRREALRLSLSHTLVPCLMQVLSATRQLFDLDAHPEAMSKSLGADPLLGRAAKQNPGLRVPGAFDGFEVAVRALLGQQVTVKAATTLAGRLVERFGETLPEDTRLGGPSTLSRLFPTAKALSDAGADAIAKVGLPGRRAESIRALAGAVARGELRLTPGADPEAVEAALVALPGVGPWTAGYIAMRALHDPDALPHGDLVLRQALGSKAAPVSNRALEAHAEAWSPWRAYATLLLWQSSSPPPP